MAQRGIVAVALATADLLTVAADFLQDLGQKTPDPRKELLVVGIAHGIHALDAAQEKLQTA